MSQDQREPRVILVDAHPSVLLSAAMVLEMEEITARRGERVRAQDPR